MTATHTPKPHRYAGIASWSGAADGMAGYAGYSREWTFEMPGKPLLRGSADVTFRGDAGFYNPEDLLLCALSTCHMLSWLAECARADIVVASYRDEAAGTMSFAEGKMRFTEVLLHPAATIARGDARKALELHERAHEGCFIASSVNFPVRYVATVEALGHAAGGE
ncbi:MAG: OsmC family protein [Candidatus Velthaea sp.]